MPKYLIESELPATGKPPMQKLKAMSKKMRPEINWLHSYVTGDKCYCLYDAPSVKKLWHHMQEGKLPVIQISKVTSIIDPTKLAVIDPTKLSLSIIDPTK
jgi:hypothetical protein